MTRLEMLTDLCAEINNYFFDMEDDAQHGKYRVEDGKLIPAPDLTDGQYYRLLGSVFNDGVHRFRESAEMDSEEHFVEDNEMVDEPEFTGTVWGMKIPPAVLTLTEEIAAWRDKNESLDSANMSPFQSESFDIYNYSKGSSGQSKSGAASAAVTWQGQFASRLNKYRRLWGI